MRSFSWQYALVFLLISPFVVACDSKVAASEFPATPSYAIPQTRATSLGSALAADVAAHPGQSAFRILTTGSESFSMRLALINAAEKTLDLQYYSIHDDTTANLLLEAVVRAARRGVRIRFLIDDINLDEVDETLSVLDGFKNLEIRVFNPFATRDRGLMSRAMLVLTDLGSIERRMHNKALISDNQMGIIGGRNLGDEYFEENTNITFKDLDILAAGPITAKLSDSFDRYWNSEESVPIGQVYKPRAEAGLVKKIRGELSSHWEDVYRTGKGRKLLSSDLAARLKSLEVKLTWAKAELAVDEPAKAQAESEAGSKPYSRLDRLLEHATREFVIVSPYFVPREDGIEWLTGLIKRGIKVRVLTNSLASTDVVAVHTGYKRYREQLVDEGVQLYELQAIGGKRPQQRLFGSGAPAHASLHAKVYVIDRRDMMIGSFNFDPRSRNLNTELAMVIHSPELSAQVIRMFEDATSPEASYKVFRQPGDGLVWEAEENHKEVLYRHDPQAGVWRSMESGLMSLLPLEDHL